MRRQLSPLIARDLQRKMVFLTGPRQAGKTTLAQHLASDIAGAQILNWDVLADRRVILAQSWLPSARLIVFDELHKMRGWKLWLKGVYDGRAPDRTIPVTGSARLEAFRQAGESLAGRYFVWHLLPVTVKEWVAATGASSEDALARMIERGGFPVPLLAGRPEDVQHWRKLYLEGLIRDDILEFSRVPYAGASPPSTRTPR